MDKMRGNKSKKMKVKKKGKMSDSRRREGRQENWDLKKRSIIAIRFSCLEAKGNGWPYKWRNTWKLSYPIRRENSFLINELHSILPLCVPVCESQPPSSEWRRWNEKVHKYCTDFNFSSKICPIYSRILELFLE